MQEERESWVRRTCNTEPGLCSVQSIKDIYRWMDASLLSALSKMNPSRRSIRCCSFLEVYSSCYLENLPICVTCFSKKKYEDTVFPLLITKARVMMS